MPRDYKPKVGGKRYKQHNPDIIQDAKNDVISGYSIRQAAKRHNLAYTVLQRHIKNEGVKKQGGQTVLSEAEETSIAEKLLICSEWGYPFDTFDLRLLVQQYLNRAGRVVSCFKDNLPGKEFAYSFLKRHSNMLSERMCQNIKRARAGVTRETITEYFRHLSEELEGVPASHIVNYDETNLCDDPGRKKIIARRRCKYPERIINHSKSSTSIMFAASGSGVLLPCYVVYKALNMYDSWTTGGPPHTRYNRSKSGWFDSYCFEDWMQSIAIPYLKKLPGKKILIGDNLSSHLSVQAIKECSENNIRFIFLPSNSTHLTQPLDVAFFKPLKTAWRKIVELYKKGPGRKEAGIAKNVFPSLLKKLLEAIEANRSNNIIAGFDKCGILPLNAERVLRMLPVEHTVNETQEDDINNSVVNILKSMRYDDNKPTQRKRKINVPAGKSVAVDDIASSDESSQHFSTHDSNSDMDPMSEYEEENEERLAGENEEFSHPSPINSNILLSVNKEDINIDDWLLINLPYTAKENGAGASRSSNRFFIAQVLTLKKTATKEIFYAKKRLETILDTCITFQM